MRRGAVIVALVLGLAVLASAWELKVESEVRGKKGSLVFVTGELGRIEDRPGRYVVRVLKELGVTQRPGVWKFKREDLDMRGNRHLRYSQYLLGLEVDGGEVIVHADPEGNVFALTLDVLPGDRNLLWMRRAHDLRKLKTMRPEAAVEMAMPGCELLSDPEVVLLNYDETGFLVYRAEIAHEPEEDSGFDRMESTIFVDVLSGDNVLLLNRFHSALNRTVYTNDNKMLGLPGTVVRTENQTAVRDLTVDEAYDNAGNTYWFYMRKFDRDSYDGKGGPLLSTVHYGKGYNNAFWNGEQMVYGDGDGVTFNDFARDLTVVAHELTHAVVEYSANLRYKDESGALNEGWADIMGMSTALYTTPVKDPEWKWLIGHECYLAGKALRFMNNPPLDGVSTDYYPDRYTGRLDNGGVHWNSGIPNLAYALIVDGGTHPQKKTSIFVPSIGLNKAEQVWYSALVHYMSANTNMSGARAACVTAAGKLYDSSTQNAVGLAWAAVGVN